MAGEAGTADRHGLFEIPYAPVLLAELRKSNRRRVLLDPASQLVDAWVDQIPTDTRAALAEECAKQFGAAARQALDALRSRPGTRPDEYYTLARRYPFTQAAGAALASAGDLALRSGDLSAAQAYYQLAQREQFTLGDERERQLQSLKQFSDPAMQAAKIPLSGPLPFDATWFGNPSTVGRAKFFPAALLRPHRPARQGFERGTSR